MMLSMAPRDQTRKGVVGRASRTYSDSNMPLLGPPLLPSPPNTTRREHLERKHPPAQGERCYEHIPGADRPGCTLRLEAHRQLETPCQRGDSALKEGVSKAQWARFAGNAEARPSRPDGRRSGTGFGMCCPRNVSGPLRLVRMPRSPRVATGG